MLLKKEELEGKTHEQIQEAYETAYTAKETEFSALASKNADGILNGFSEKLATLTGIQRNGNDEKVSAHFERITNDWLPEATKKKLTKAEQERDEWKEKFTNHKGDETIKTELARVQSEIAKIPELLSQKETEWKTKYDTLDTTFKTEKLTRSLTDAMPKFDENVNQFELKAKKQNAIERIQESYELSYDEKGNLIGTKDYQKHLVSELLKGDEELKDLILIEQNSGGGGEGGKKQTKTLSIPANLSKGAAQEIIKEYIIEVEKIEFLSDKFPIRYKELLKENAL